jgi:hypothetical protein
LVPQCRQAGRQTEEEEEEEEEEGLRRGRTKKKN